MMYHHGRALRLTTTSLLTRKGRRSGWGIIPSRNLLNYCSPFSTSTRSATPSFSSIAAADHEGRREETPIAKEGSSNTQAETKKPRGEHPLNRPDAVAEILDAVKRQREKEIRARRLEEMAAKKQDEAISVDSTTPPVDPDSADDNPDPATNNPPPLLTTITPEELLSRIKETPRLPSRTHKPKQSLGQNYLNDAKMVAKIIRTFHEDALRNRTTVGPMVELGPGIGALTDPLFQIYGPSQLQCIEIDERSVRLLQQKHEGLRVHHESVLGVDFRKMALKAGEPLTVIGNMPYNITSKILFALADAAAQHGAIRSATVTMQREVGDRVIARPCCKDYGILSVMLQLSADITCHFQIPPEVFYPQPKVTSALFGLHFLDPTALQRRLVGVQPSHVRKVAALTFQQRRKTLRNSLKNVYKTEYGVDEGLERLQTLLLKHTSSSPELPPPPLPEIVQQAMETGDYFAKKQALPNDWASKRAEELSPGQFVELTRLIYGDDGNGDGDDDES